MDEEEAQAQRVQLVDEAYAKDLFVKQELLDRKARAQRMRNENLTLGIVYQVTMDATGKTIAGYDDHDNGRHLKHVKSIFEGDMQANRLQLKSVTYYCNHALDCKFEQAKQALVAIGHDVTERTYVVPIQVHESFLIKTYKDILAVCSTALQTRTYNLFLSKASVLEVWIQQC